MYLLLDGILAKRAGGEGAREMAGSPEGERAREEWRAFLKSISRALRERARESPREIASFPQAGEQGYERRPCLVGRIAHSVGGLVWWGALLTL